MTQDIAEAIKHIDDVLVRYADLEDRFRKVGNNASLGFPEESWDYLDLPPGIGAEVFALLRSALSRLQPDGEKAVELLLTDLPKAYNLEGTKLRYLAGALKALRADYQAGRVSRVQTGDAAGSRPHDPQPSVPNPKSESTMITVLVLASSPVDQGPLHLGKEHKVIKHSLDSATNRDQFRVVQCMATTVDDLRRYLLEYTPNIVHFTGHGSGPTGLCFETEQGGTHPVNGERLAKLFHLVQDDVKCVVLNACFSEAQAKAISEHIDFVIGMKDEIGDFAAIKFAQGFYEAVWAGQSFDKAFKFGCSAIDTANIPQEHIPVILKSPRLGGLRLEYSEDTQRMENFILRYMNSEPEERASLTTQGSTITERLTELRKKGGPRKTSSVSVLSSQTIAGGYKAVRAVIRSGLDANEHTFYLKPVGDSFLMDWDATMGWWPIPFNTYKAIGSDRQITVRVIAELDDYFNYDYDRRDFISVKLHHLYDGYIHGYISVTNPLCQQLVQLLYDGGRHRIIVRILPHPIPTHVRITRLVSDSWILPEDSGNVSNANEPDNG